MGAQTPSVLPSVGLEFVHSSVFAEWFKPFACSVRIFLAICPREQIRQPEQRLVRWSRMVFRGCSAEVALASEVPEDSSVCFIRVLAIERIEDEEAHPVFCV